MQSVFKFGLLATIFILGFLGCIYLVTSSDRQELTVTYSTLDGRCKELGGEWLPVTGVSLSWKLQKFRGEQLLGMKDHSHNDLNVLGRKMPAMDASRIFWQDAELSGFDLVFEGSGVREDLRQLEKSEGLNKLRAAKSIYTVSSVEFHHMNQSFKMPDDETVYISQKRAICDLRENLIMKNSKAIRTRSFFSWTIERDDTKSIQKSDPRTFAQGFFEHRSKFF